MSDLFYIVVSDERGPGSYPHRHCTLTAAQTEAKRLAREKRGVKFFVLASLGHAFEADAEWEDGAMLREIHRLRKANEDEIPF